MIADIQEIVRSEGTSKDARHPRKRSTRLSASRFLEILVVERRPYSINLGLAHAMAAGFPSPVGNAARNVDGDLLRLDVLQLEIWVKGTLKKVR